MNKLLALTMAVAMATSTTVHAGGPVLIEEEAEVVAQKPASSVGVLPLLLIPILLCVAFCGGDDDEGGGEPEKD